MADAVLTVASASSILAIEPLINYCYDFLQGLVLGVEMQMWAACPFCRRTFEVTAEAKGIRVDGQQRYVCASCAGKGQAPAEPPKPPAKPNGETVHATQVREVPGNHLV